MPKFFKTHEIDTTSSSSEDDCLFMLDEELQQIDLIEQKTRLEQKFENERLEARRTKRCAALEKLNSKRELEALKREHDKKPEPIPAFKCHFNC